MVRREKMNTTVKVVDKNTGEVRNAEVYKVFTVNTENAEKFYQQYANGVLAVIGIKPYYCASVFMYISMYSNNGEFILDKVERQKIMDETGLSVSSITKAFLQLNDYGIVKRVCKGRYTINPAYAWSGSLSDRTKILNNARVDIRIAITPNEEILDKTDIKLIEEKESENNFNNN